VQQNGKNVPNDPKNIRRPEKVPENRRIFQMGINMLTFSIPRPSKKYPNWEFWCGNISSGNPDSEHQRKL
jgi:hypothetical protein